MYRSKSQYLFLSCTMCQKLAIGAQHIGILIPNVRADVYVLKHFSVLK